MRGIVFVLALAARVVVGRRGPAAAPRMPRVRGRSSIMLVEHMVKEVMPVRAGVLLRSWQKQAEDSWAQGFTPTSTMDGMRRLSSQVKQLQRMAALARVMTMRQLADDAAPATPIDSHFAPYLSRLPHTSILAAVAPGNGTAIAFSTTLPDCAEMLHIEANPICSDEHARNAQAALLDEFIARAAGELAPSATLIADASPGSVTQALLLARGFSETGGADGWMADGVRYTRAVSGPYAQLE